LLFLIPFFLAAIGFRSNERLELPAKRAPNRGLERNDERKRRKDTAGGVDDPVADDTGTAADTGAVGNSNIKSRFARLFGLVLLLFRVHLSQVLVRSRLALPHSGSADSTVDPDKFNFCDISVVDCGSVGVDVAGDETILLLDFGDDSAFGTAIFREAFEGAGVLDIGLVVNIAVFDIDLDSLSGVFFEAFSWTSTMPRESVTVLPLVFAETRLLLRRSAFVEMRRSACPSRRISSFIFLMRISSALISLSNFDALRLVGSVVALLFADSLDLSEILLCVILVFDNSPFINTAMLEYFVGSFDLDCFVAFGVVFFVVAFVVVVAFAAFVL
jgi:hypothetical protein